MPLQRVHLHEVPTDDAWMRDHGPTFVTRAAATGASWRWSTGATTPGAGSIRRGSNDDRVPAARWPRTSGCRAFAPGIVLEGGSIDVNGAGTLLTTEPCLLNPNRNPQLDARRRSSSMLCDYLGARRVLWLGDGIVGDDTDGHIDDLTRFVAPGDGGHRGRGRSAPTRTTRRLQDNLQRLRRMRDAAGRPLRVVTPADAGRRSSTTASACRPPTRTSTSATRAVLVPVFGSARAMRAALATLRELFPGRTRGRRSTPPTWSGGSAPFTASPSSSPRLVSTDASGCYGRRGARA